MKVVALLSWYEESPSWLGALVAGLKGWCDHLVAVDGAYFLYPEGRPFSGPEQADALWSACQGAGIGCTIHRPQEVWRGNEVEKRTFLFRAAEIVAEPYKDWYYVCDGDDLVTRVPFDLKERLEGAEQDAGEVKLYWRDDWQTSQTMAEVVREIEVPEESYAPLRAFFRAIPGLQCRHAHMVYCYEKDGETVYLRGREDAHMLDPVVDLTDFHVEHRHNWRPKHRKHQANDYYQLRDLLHAEDIPEHVTGAAA